MGALRIRLEPGFAARGAALMGVLNVTPDSFFDGGSYVDVDAARARVDALIAQGADIIDVGGESSRPGSERVAADEQIRRIEPAVRHAVGRGACVSIDTTDPGVADRALALGARIVNDVSCLRDADLAKVCARYEAVLVIMHSREPMSTMGGFSRYAEDGYGDVVADVLAEWQRARARAEELGVSRERIWLDPGIGFSKSARHSFKILRELSRLVGQAPELVIGASRKSFMSTVAKAPPEERLGGSIAAALLAVERGATVVRVHDLRETDQALRVARAIRSDIEKEAARA